MAAPASHQPNPTPAGPEMAGAEAMEVYRPSGEVPLDSHDYSIYVLEGVRHPDGSSGLIFTFNPSILPIKDSDTHKIARNIHLSLLPLKRKEQELKSSVAGEDVSEKDLVFRVEANEAPIKIIRDGEIVDGDEEALDLLFANDGQEEGYTVMHGWPAVRLDYDTSLIDHTSVVKAVSYILSSQMPSSERDIWIEDFSTDVNIERLLDPSSVRPGNPNEHVRRWVRGLLAEEEPGEPHVTPREDRHHNPRFSRIAASLSSLIKIT